MADLVEVEVMISGGRDTDVQRDVAGSVLIDLQHMFRKEMHEPVFIDQWDYRRASPTVVPSGAMAALSLQQVEQTHILIVLLDQRVPEITGQEVERALELRATGRPLEVYAYTRPPTPAEITDFLSELKTRLGLEVVYAPYDDHLTLQARLFTTLVPYVLARLIAPGTAP